MTYYLFLLLFCGVSWLSGLSGMDFYGNHNQRWYEETFTHTHQATTQTAPATEEIRMGQIIIHISRQDVSLLPAASQPFDYLNIVGPRPTSPVLVCASNKVNQIKSALSSSKTDILYE